MAFTLIELLVVVAIIALLLSILLPSLSDAREAAKAAVCGAQMRGYAVAQTAYNSENSDWIPGVNTSGIAVRAQKQNNFPANTLCQPKMPTQSYDWMTPILAPNQELPANRAERMNFIWEKFRCPTIQNVTAVKYTAVTAPDATDFDKFKFVACSYLQAAFFQFYGQKNLVKFRMDSTRPITVDCLRGSSGWNVTVDDYVPKVGQVGPAARKIFIADGTRYMRADKLIDFDFSPDPDTYGAFTDGGAYWAGSTAYGVATRSANWDGDSVSPSPTCPAEGSELPLSYRHGKGMRSAATSAKSNRGTLDALFFDGHVQRMTDKESREPHLWYPSGAKVIKPNEGMITVPQDYIIP